MPLTGSAAWHPEIDGMKHRPKHDGLIDSDYMASRGPFPKNGKRDKKESIRALEAMTSQVYHF